VIPGECTQSVAIEPAELQILNCCCSDVIIYRPVVFANWYGV